MGNLSSISAFKHRPLRSLNWIYVVLGQGWYLVKSLLIANVDDKQVLRKLPADANTSEQDMGSVVTQDTAELRLLPVERAPTSPFPSPGSPFYPPPRLGAHEFALRPSSSRSHNTQKDRDDLNDPDRPNMDGATTPTAPTSAASLTPSLSLTSPTTPTPSSGFAVKTPTTQITVPDPPPNSERPVSLSAAAAALTNSNRDSLTSSRPAPPSPAVSRRASTALSRHSSSARSRRQSKASSLLQASHEPEASSSSATTVVPATQQQQQQPKRRSLLFKIKDFAFPSSDDRHAGKGPDAPRANRPRRRWSTYSSASVSSMGSSRGDEDEAQEGAGGWGSYRWNTLSTHFSWGGAGQGPQEGGPSMTDFGRNFGSSSPSEEKDDPYDDDDEEYEDAQQDGEDEPLLPGLYRAIYAFDPEGTAEMALEEEQVVRVVGRGGGVGWAVVEKEDGGHALVPESYLELVEAD